MFEKALLERSQGKRSPWSLAGLAVQGIVVGSLLLVPIISPEVMSVVLPRPTLLVPLKSPAPPVETPQTQSATAPQQSALVAAARPVRAFQAPRSWSNPVASIIDLDGSLPLLPLGSGVGMAAGPSIPGAIPSIGATVSAPPPKPVPPPKEPEKRMVVGGRVQEANILSRVQPVYPPMAKTMRISGRVQLEGIIDKDGTVQRLKVLSGHPLLVQAALEAVKQWRYRPTMLNGQPVEVIAPIEVNFVLAH